MRILRQSLTKGMTSLIVISRCATATERGGIMDSIWFPSDETVRQSVRDLHESSVRASVICSGGGFGLSQILWSVPGIGNEIFEIMHPIDWRAHLHLGGYPVPDVACSEEEAAHFARVAWSRMNGFANFIPPRFEADDLRVLCTLTGVAVTAFLTTDHPRVVIQNRICAAACLDENAFAITLNLRKGRMNRSEQGKVADLVGLNLLLKTASLPMLPFDSEAFNDGDFLPDPNNPERVII
jgi:hypothetical protein